MVIQERRGLIRASMLTAEPLWTKLVRQGHQKQCYSIVAVVKASNTEAHLQLVLAEGRPKRRRQKTDGGTEPHKSNPLTQRVTCMETNGCIPSSQRQRFSFSAPQMSQAPSFSLHRQDMASPMWHLLALKQMLL